MNKLLLALSVALITACSQAPSSSDVGKQAVIDPPEGPVVAVVNGESVTEPMLTVYARGRGLDPAQAAQRQQALDSLVENVLLAQDAIATGLTDKPEVKAEAALVRLQQIAGRALAEKRQSLQVSDAQIQQLYDEERSRAGDTEWRLQHILFATQAEAVAALQQALAPDADFEALMSAFPNAKQGKELGWSNATQLPPEFLPVLQQLNDGEVAPIAVQSAFGFHVLRRAESRPFSPPPLETVREGARTQILENAMKEYVQSLRTKADIATSATAPQQP